MILQILKMIIIYILHLISYISFSNGQTATKAVIDFCDSRDSESCGDGHCIFHRSGNRCQCPHGWMGRKCQRPCQDVYKSCIRWKEEERCSWTRPISPFFNDNCALSCGVCQSNGKQLSLTLPPILDNIAWFVGRWESRTLAGDRYPESISGPYTEVLEVQISDVPMFDRPPVNISTYATTFDGKDVHREVGFMTSKPFKEDTGFVEFNKPDNGDDKVAIESVGNTGLLTIEEGIVRGTSIKLETIYKKSVIGWWKEFKEAKRLFILINSDTLEERVIMTDTKGITKKWLKRYRRTFDYLKNFVPTVEVNSDKIKRRSRGG